jgi:hypothetical protein
MDFLSSTKRTKTVILTVIFTIKIAMFLTVAKASEVLRLYMTGKIRYKLILQVTVAE